ncbi:hypothetical protein BDY24DRAFT_411697 [Mrakia frigida]|uniref:uncharacterized protein n=1 Tax=Mrakia frigida TaxID=29902 RepID=UPI003FCC0A63
MPYFSESDTSSYPSQGFVAPTGRTGGIVAVVLGSLVGALLIFGSFTAAFYGSRVRSGRYAEVDALTRRLRLRQERILELEKERPELVEVVIEEEETKEELEKMDEEVLPLAVTLLPSNDKHSYKHSTKALVSFLIRLPSSQDDTQPSTASSASCDSQEDWEGGGKLEIVFGSDLVELDGEEVELLSELGKKEES